MDKAQVKKAFATKIHKRKGIPVIADELCLINNDNDYVGITTGTVYSRLEYGHSDVLIGRVITIDMQQRNGMIHLDPKCKDGIKNINKKHSFVGCIMPFREAHNFGHHTVYQSLFTNEYYNDIEIEFI